MSRFAARINGGRFRRRRGRGGGPPVWTVRAHLTSIVVAVIVVFGVVGAYLGRDTVRNAEDNVAVNAAALAGLAADAVAANVALGQEQVAAIAANPALPALLADPSQCQLAFSLELFPAAHLDVLLTDGRVLCSSASLTSAAASHGGAAWLADLTGARDRAPAAPTAAFDDSLTGESAVAIAAPVLDPDGQILGAVAAVLPTR